MTSYLTQPFSDLTGPVYNALNNWQSDVNANTDAAATKIAKARTDIQAKYDEQVVQPWQTAQLAIIAQRQTDQLAIIAQKKANADSSALLGQAIAIAIKTAIDVAIADKIDKRMREIARDQRDLADRQLKMGEVLHARYVSKFAPIEDAAADFARNDWEKNRYKPQYALQQGRAKLDAARAFGKVAGKLNKKMTRYCTGANANMLRQVVTDWARMEVDMVNRAWRLEESKMWGRDDLQWTRMQNAISNGQRLPSQAAQDVANGIRTASESNAVRGQAMQGWYGALARGADGLFQFGYGALEQQKAAQYAQLPGMARGAGGAGSLGTSGMQNSQIGYNDDPFDGYMVNSPSLTDGSATGADYFRIDDTEA